MRNRPDAQRWRVTMSDSSIEVFRRPVLTSEITLGAIGIGNAPMPVPQCICMVKLDATSTNVDIFDATDRHLAHASMHDAYAIVMNHIQVETASFNDS